eukprot:42463-Pleurochrysis_carterae.AAC.1
MASCPVKSHHATLRWGRSSVARCSAALLGKRATVRHLPCSQPARQPQRSYLACQARRRLAPSLRRVGLLSYDRLAQRQRGETPYPACPPDQPPTRQPREMSKARFATNKNDT